MGTVPGLFPNGAQGCATGVSGERCRVAPSQGMLHLKLQKESIRIARRHRYTAIKSQRLKPWRNTLVGGG